MLRDVREIPLTKGRVAIIDAADYETLSAYRWRAFAPNGRETHYAVSAVRSEGRSVTLLMHRMIMDAPRGACVDHINGDGLDNRRANLRLCTTAENLANQRKPKTNTSGFKGVSEYGKVWRAAVGPEHLGCFDTAEIAALAYDAAARRRYGEFAHLNFPDRNDQTPAPRVRGVPFETRLEVLAAHYAGAELGEALKVVGVSRTAAWAWKQDPVLVRRARIIALQTLLAADQ